MTELFEDLTWSTTFPEWLIHDFRHERCVLSDRMCCAEVGKDWDWQGLTENDFDDPISKVIFKACKWIEQHGDGETCITANVRQVAKWISDETGVFIGGAVRSAHRVALQMDRLWSTLTVDDYDHVTALKRLTRRRDIIRNATEAINVVMERQNPDYNIRELVQLESVKSRKRKQVWK